MEHLFPDSLNLSNQPNPLLPKFPYLCMQYTPISAHSGMPTYYGGPLKHSGSATVITRRFRLPVPYCFLYLVRVPVRDRSRSDSHPCPWPERARKKNCPLLRFARVCSLLFASLRKPGIARILCAIFRRDLSQRQFGPVITDIIIIAIAIAIVIQPYLRDDLRTLPSRLIVLHPIRQLGQEPLLVLAREIQRGTSCPDPSAPRVPG